MKLNIIFSKQHFEPINKVGSKSVYSNQTEDPFNQTDPFSCLNLKRQNPKVIVFG